MSDRYIFFADSLVIQIARDVVIVVDSSAVVSDSIGGGGGGCTDVVEVYILSDLSDTEPPQLICSSTRDVTYYLYMFHVNRT